MGYLGYVFLFIFGTIIGSFLNVVLYRFHTGKSLSGRSHCMSCGRVLDWYELFPIFSYLFLWGRCRSCFSHIPYRYLFVECVTGLLYLSMWHLYADDIVFLIMNLALVTLLVLVVVYDVRHTIIPDEGTIGIGVVALVFLGHTYIQSNDISIIFLNVIGGLCGAFFFWGLWYMSKGRWIGFGDVKLALPLGILVGLEGIFTMIVLSFWTGAIISLTLLGIERILKKGKTNLRFLQTPLTIKSEVPFAPFMVVGFSLVYFLHADIFKITYALFFSW